MKSLEEFSGNIFLTGGTGFVGKSILDLKKRNFLSNIKLTVLSRSPDLFIASNPELASIPSIKFVTGDVRNFTFPNQKFDYIFHAAAPAMEMPPGVERDIIINGTKRILRFAEHCQAKRILFLSSGAVYGPESQKLDRIPECFPCNPVTEYGIAKYEAEQLCLSSSQECVIARGFAFTGPHLNRNIHFAIGNFIRDCLNGLPINIKGDGTPFRSYLYADDMVEWFFSLLFKGKCGTAYNVGSDEALSIAELAKKIRALLNPALPIIVNQKESPGADIHKYIPDISKARQELGLQIRYNLSEAILKSATESKI